MALIKRNFLLILVLILGFYLRFNLELFIQGYCFDELAMVAVAKQQFPFGILKSAALLDYHAPLYYFVAHFFVNLQYEWQYLRYFNLILSLINIVVFYLIGKEAVNKRIGLLCALFFAINHLAISTVSFVKFYCMCFLIASLSILFFIRALKKEKYLKILGIVNAFFAFSATLGFIFVFFEYLILYLSKKFNTKKILKSALIALIGFILYLPVLIYQTNTAFHNILSPHGAYSGAYFTEIFGIFNDYISPFLNYCCNYNTMRSNEIFYVFLSELFLNKSFDKILLVIFIAFSFIPIGISLYMNFLSIKNNKYLKTTALVGYLFFVTMIILIKCQVLGLVTIYFYPFGLIFIVLTVSGFYYTKNKILKYLFLIYLVFIQLFITNVFPVEKRESYKDKIYYCIDEYFKQNKNDENTVYVMTAGGRFLEKYYQNKNIISFDYEQMGASHEKKFIRLIYGDDIANNANKHNIRTLIKAIIENNKKNPEFEKYVIENVINKAKKGQKIVLAFNTDSSPFIDSDENISKILNSKKYTSTLLDPIEEIYVNGFESINTSDILNTISSYSNKYLFEILDKNLRREKIEQYTMMPEFYYKKTFESKKLPYSTIWIAQHANKGWVFVTYFKQ